MQRELIAERAAALRLTSGWISKATGITGHTIGRTLNGRTRPFHETAEKIEAAIVAEELRVRDYLIGLHPIEPKAPEAT